MSKLIIERFSTIYGFLKTSNERPNNKAMRGEDSSKSHGDKEWYGTSSYEEAEDLFRNGYTQILQEVLDGVRKSEKQFGEINTAPKMIPRNQIVGYTPHIPNAIIGIPESMINTNRVVQKRKTIDVTYSCSMNCGTSAESIKKAGIALLSAIKIIETTGVFIKLDLAAIVTEAGSELALPLINVKEYHERLDIQKLCFPIAHPSMLRRFGFKWLETNPDITSTDFRYGYGHSLENVRDIKQRIQFADKMHVLNAGWIIDHHYNVGDIIQYLKDEFK